jgi:hypothetical protein
MQVAFGKFQTSNATYEDKMEYHQLVGNEMKRMSKKQVAAVEEEDDTNQDGLSSSTSSASTIT